MKKLRLKAPKAALLQARTAKKTAWLKAHGVDRVLVVYEKGNAACLYPEPRVKP